MFLRKIDKLGIDELARLAGEVTMDNCPPILLDNLLGSYSTIMGSDLGKKKKEEIRGATLMLLKHETELEVRRIKNQGKKPHPDAPQLIELARMRTRRTSQKSNLDTSPSSDIIREAIERACEEVNEAAIAALITISPENSPAPHPSHHA